MNSSDPHNPSYLQPPLILVIEDSSEDFEALDRSFRQSSVKIRLHRSQTGKQALEYLEKCLIEKQVYPENVPALILLDLNLPGMKGQDVLQSIKQNPLLYYIPTVILTTSLNLKDIHECYRLGANSYLVKKMEWKSFKQSMHIMVEYWLNTVTLP
ncbi:MAG: response regulator [Alkalinema sp. CAN_BIN05]|nr:response regulator [Alkalinema sp. CAN_BIN05]